MEIEKMITKKEDLVNTYIVKGDDALTKAYLNACKEYVDIFALQCDRWPKDRHLYFNPKCKHIQSGECDTSKYKEITIKDLKPRTKTEYELLCNSRFNVWGLKDLLESGSLFYFINDEYRPVSVGSDIFAIEHFLSGHIYRKVETEIDERQEFIDRWVSEIKNVGTMTYKDILGKMYDDVHSG